MAIEEGNLEAIPAELASQPYLEPYHAALFKAFIQLSSSRGQGFNGPQPITISDALARSFALDLCDHDHFIDLVRMLDDVYLAWAEERRPKT